MKLSLFIKTIYLILISYTVYLTDGIPSESFIVRINVLLSVGYLFEYGLYIIKYNYNSKEYIKFNYNYFISFNCNLEKLIFQEIKAYILNIGSIVYIILHFTIMVYLVLLAQLPWVNFMLTMLGILLQVFLLVFFLIIGKMLIIKYMKNHEHIGDFVIVSFFLMNLPMPLFNGEIINSISYYYPFSRLFFFESSITLWGIATKLSIFALFYISIFATIKTVKYWKK